MSTVGFIEMEKPIMIPQAETEKIDNTPIEIAQAAKDKVFVVWYDNGLEWDDNFQDIDRIFMTYTDAEKYLMIVDIQDRLRVDITENMWHGIRLMTRMPTMVIIILPDMKRVIIPFVSLICTNC